MRKILCLLNRHQPRKGSDRWNGSVYVRECTSCTRYIVRDSFARRWVAVKFGETRRLKKAR